jgi:hypothetical protein
MYLLYGVGNYAKTKIKLLKIALILVYFTKTLHLNLPISNIQQISLTIFSFACG